MHVFIITGFIRVMQSLKKVDLDRINPEDFLKWLNGFMSREDTTDSDTALSGNSSDSNKMLALCHGDFHVRSL